MIKIENSRVTVSGTGALLKSELGMCICTMLKQKILTEENLDSLVALSKELANKSDEELDKEIEEKLSNVLSKVVSKILKEEEENKNGK